MIALLCLLIAAEAPDAEDPARVVSSAQNAFEYRDFAQVVALLEPWVHPPRIVDPELLRDARLLLGISEHILGRSDAAREEFAQVLLSAPELKLDPFVVPPDVIETFEAVRSQMAPVLDRIRAERENAPQVFGPTAYSPLLGLLPFGLTHLIVLDEPAWGATWLSLQLAGLAANVAGYWGAQNLKTMNVVPDEQRSTFNTLKVVQFVGLGVFAAALVSSVVHAEATLAERRVEEDQLERKAASRLSPVSTELW